MNDTEDKIVLKTKMIVGTITVGGSFKKGIMLENVLAAFGETYMQADSIGWETKALDALFEAVRQCVD